MPKHGKHARRGLAAVVSLAAMLGTIAVPLTRARVWAGFHFRTACVQGNVLGGKVAEFLARNYFKPVR